jgi:hypothetical protein
MEMLKGRRKQELLKCVAAVTMRKKKVSALW